MIDSLSADETEVAVAPWDGAGLTVADDYRGQGLGRALVVAAEAWLKARNAPAVRLMVRGDNAQVTGFYAALGYERSDIVVLGRRLDKD